jgi:phosphoribosylformylglycinamidine (FGAM) synthase-like amidotransferase family enzyme
MSDLHTSKGYGSMSLSGFASNKFQIVRNQAGRFVIRRSSFTVNTRMDTTASWVVKGKKTAALLKHEQGHYDISALAARQFHDNALRLEADTAQELIDEGRSCGAAQRPVYLPP